MNVAIIYFLKNKINNKVYVGQTWRTLDERMKSGYVGCPKIHRAIKKYGKNNFYYELITFCFTQEAADKIEINFIEKYDSIKNGYNVCMGGSGVMKGRKHTPESLAKIGKASKNISDETRLKRSLASTGERNGFYGKKHSKESIAKISGENNHGAKLNDEKVIEINKLLDDGNLTLDKIGKMFNVSRSIISSINAGKNWGHLKINNKKRPKKTKKIYLNESGVCESYVSGLNMKEVSKIYNCSASTIRLCLIRNNVVIRDGLNHTGQFKKGQNKHV